MMDELSHFYPDREANHLADILLEWISGKRRQELMAETDLELGNDAGRSIERALDQLRLYRPVQYITGKSWFYDLEFSVNEDVLIPRPETEELVDWILKDDLTAGNLEILDIGTGSGCIAVTLARQLKDSTVTALDNSAGALRMAAKNASEHDVTVNFLLKDILDPNDRQSLEVFDVIVSNPPYVREQEKALMKPNVLDHEPAMALFVPDDDPLIYYRAILALSDGHLKSGGRIYLEINENFGAGTASLFTESGFGKVDLKKDIHGRDRFIRASR